MRWQVLLLVVAPGCADWGRPPLTAPYRSGEPLIQEQALVGISRDGSAAAVQLIDAEGAAPRLELLALDGKGGATRHLAVAPPETATVVARQVRAEGTKAVPLLGAIAAHQWPEALGRAARDGFSPAAPTAPDAGPQRWSVAPRAGPGAPPLMLRIAVSESDPRAFTLLLSVPPDTDGSATQVEVARQPISGTPIDGGLWQTADIVWLLSGSVAEGEPLRRAIGLRRGSIRRGEAELHDHRGSALRAARDLDGAAREFDRAVGADPRFVDALYNAASTAASSGREEEAVAWLRRAAEVDRRRVQILARDDDALQALRERPEIRDILGMKRPPPQTSK